MEFKEMINKINKTKESNIEKIKNLTLECETIIEENNSVIIKKLVEKCKNRIEKILEFLKVEKYNLYFNGEVGVGKTTVISILLGLIDEKASQVEKYALLPTASGRTTVCETKIVFGNEYLISFTSVSEDRLNEYLRDWADSSKNCIKECNEAIKLSSEICSWIIHAMGFKDKADDELKEIIRNANSSEELYEKAKKLINYASRKELENEVFTAENFFECYSILNNGRDKNLKMPENITLTIPIENCNFKSIVASICDTKGIDSPARSDIRENIESKDSVSIMCEKIESFGSYTTIELLKPELKRENKDFKHRVLLLGIDRGNELSCVNDAEGDADRGKSLKEEEAKSEFVKNNIGFNENNYLFYNPLDDKYKKDDGTPNIIRIKEDSEEILKMIIDKTIRNMVDQYEEELIEIELFLKKIHNGSLDDKFNEKISELNEKVKEIYEEWCNGNGTDEKKIWESFENELSNKKKISCASALRGAVNHNGKFNADIYETMKDGANNYYDNIFKEVKIKLEEKIKSIPTFQNEIEDACFSYIKKLILEDYYDECFFSYVKKVDLENKIIMYNDNFWKTARQYWGDGGKYTYRVHAVIENGLINEKKIIYNNQIGEYDDRGKNGLLYEYFDKILSLLNFK